MFKNIDSWVLIPKGSNKIVLVDGEWIGKKKMKAIRRRLGGIGKFTAFKEKLNYDNVTVYNPLITHPRLYMEFAKLECQEESILKFANRYGDLCPVYFEDKNGDIIQGTPLDEWYKHIKLIQTLLPLVKPFVEDKEYPDVNKIKKAVESLKQNKEFEKYIKKGEYSNESIINTAKDIVISIINEVLEGNTYFQFLNFLSKDKYEQIVYFENLLGILYYEIYLDVFQKIPLTECEYCHTLFVPQRKGQRFCPESFKKYNEETGEWIDIPTGKHCRKNAFKTEKKVVELYKKGYSVEEIYNQLTEKQKAYATPRKIQEIIKKTE
ncbi:hypothetical protein [Caldanaerobacter subterraneus]|uniref:hypothetical protein n=1 Tax=Caldanaerobacter subterraneus TaxID=911092 RepID=UPI0019FAD949|nr:hypothetical protein [Caldanaerobacter subterraneus]